MSSTIIVTPPFNGYPVCAAFNGRSSRISLGNPGWLNFNGSITLSAWVRPNNTTGTGIYDIVAHGYTSNPNAEVFLRINGGNYQAGSYNGSDHLAQVQIPAGDQDNWVFLAGVYTGTQWILYRNGVQAATSGDKTGAMTVNDNWSIGSTGDGTSRFFQGFIRNVAIWNIGRSAGQVAADMYNPPLTESTGLAGYWPLNHGSGNIAFDYSGNENNGILTGTGWFTPPVIVPDTLICPGNPLNGYIGLGNPAKLNFSGTITLMAWIMPKVITGYGDIVAHGYTSNPDAEVYLRINSGNYEIGSYNGSDHLAQLSIPPGDVMNWVHLAGTYDGSAWNLYRNGVLTASNQDTTGAITVNDNWSIGATGDGSSRYLTACVKGVSIWNIALSAGQIQTAIQKGISGTETGLAAYWPLEEGAGPTVFDYKQPAANGTLQSAGWYRMPRTPGWFQLTAKGNFQDMILPVVLNYRAIAWAMAGQYQTNVVLSYDGVEWEQVTTDAGWAERRDAAGCVFLEKMWLMGGDGISGVFNDVWQSSDGENWTCVTSAAPWGARYGHGVVVFNNLMWLMGGSNISGKTYNDVWSTPDGINWTCVTPAAGWSMRYNAGVAVFNNLMWVCGGGYNGNGIQDVWSSADGINWTKMVVPGWSARFIPNLVALSKQLYIIGGINTGTGGLNDMWMTTDGNTWTEIDADAPWAPRTQMGALDFDDHILLMGGIANSQAVSSVWRYVPPRSMQTTSNS